MSPSAAGRGVVAALGLTTLAMLWATGSSLVGMEVPQTIELPSSSGLPTGARAPDFHLPTIDGDSLSLGQLRGRVAVVCFWATWCGPCRLELPRLQQLREEYAGRGVEVVAISVDFDRARVVPMARRLGLTYPVLLGDGVAQSAYRVLSLPTLFVVDAGGVIRYRHVGYAPGVERAVAEQVESLLGEG
jgi:peroxiredoxin